MNIKCDLETGKWNCMKGLIWVTAISIAVAVIACLPETSTNAPEVNNRADVEPTSTKTESMPIESGIRLRGTFALEGKKFQHGRIGEVCQGYDKSRDIGDWLSVSIYDSMFNLINEAKLQEGVTDGSQCLFHWESSLTPSYTYRICLWHCIGFEPGELYFDSGWIDIRILEALDYSVQWVIKSDYNAPSGPTLPNIIR